MQGVLHLGSRRIWLDRCGMQDQAAKLRQMVRNLDSHPDKRWTSPPGRGCRRIAVTSGKGGVGKTHLSVNLALALADRGLRVLLFDADFGLANVDVLLGIIPQYTLLHVLSGQKNLEEVMIDGPLGLKLIAAGSGGVQELAEIGESQRNRFLKELEALENLADIMIIDTGAGIHRNVLSFALAADDVLVVTTPEPTALMDAYGMMKVLHREHAGVRIALAVNQAATLAEAEEAEKKLIVLTKRFLGLEIHRAGLFPRDPAVVSAVKQQRPVFLTHPSSPFSEAVRRLADHWARHPTPLETGGISFFKRVAQLISGGKHG